jgi:PPOX class probable F420-dependent enzyme
MIDFSTDFGRRIKRRLEQEYFVWFTTTGTDLNPQPRPVWFIWEQESFLIYSQPGAHKVAHVKLHPDVCLHFNCDARADEDVTIILGRAQIDPAAPPAHEVPAYLEKYAGGIAGLDMTPESFSREYALAIRVKPTKVRGG